jgi:hypothetical protein
LIGGSPIRNYCDNRIPHILFSVLSLGPVSISWSFMGWALKLTCSQELDLEELIVARGAAASGKGSSGQLAQEVNRPLSFGEGPDTILFRAGITKCFAPSSCVFGRRREAVRICARGWG